MTTRPLQLTREQILAHRRTVGALDDRLPPGAGSLRRAAWAGLQDSMPRAALLSIHARVEGTKPSAWEDPSLVQLWGPRFSAYVVAARDRAVFTLGRLPEEGKGLRRAVEMAARVGAYLRGRKMGDADVARGLGVGNAIRYAIPTGTLLIRWDGARRPTVWSVPPPDVDPDSARLELARRYLHVFGPATPSAFARWAGISQALGPGTFDTLARSLTPVRTPVGDAWILSKDEPTFRAAPKPPLGARLLPSGDAYFLLQGADRQLLVPEAARRAALWTSRVWPGAILLSGELVGTWRRSDALVTAEPWRKLSKRERETVEAEAESLPLPGIRSPVRVRWTP